MATITTSRSGKPASGSAPASALVTGMTRRRQAARLVAVAAVPLIAYFAVRPVVGSDAAGLAIAGAVPAAWTIALVLRRRRVDQWAVLASAGYALGCVASLLKHAITPEVTATRSPRWQPRSSCPHDPRSARCLRFTGVLAARLAGKPLKQARTH